MKKTFTLFIFLINLIVYAQEQDYFIVDNQKTFCNDLSFKITAQSYLKAISYTDNNGKKIEIDGRKKIPNISTFFIDGMLIDKIPQKVNKPKKYIKWAERIVDGKLIVNYYNNSISLHSGGSSPVTTSITKHYVKMPDGTYYNLQSKKARKKHLIPYLKKCKQFNSEYKGKFKYQEFDKIIELYNKLCE